MERKIVLEIEELEERIAPHAWFGAELDGDPVQRNAGIHTQTDSIVIRNAAVPLEGVHPVHTVEESSFTPGTYFMSVNYPEAAEPGLMNATHE